LHEVADRQAIPPKPLPAAPDGLGVGSTLQAVPFQASAKVWVTPAVVFCEPAAVQAPTVHETVEKPMLVAPAGLGAVAMVQDDPFKDATSPFAPTA
jgi:hypothetical protein